MSNTTLYVNDVASKFATLLPDRNEYIIGFMVGAL